MKIRFMIPMLFLLLTALSAAQDHITFASVVRLALPNDGSPRVFPSPDGTQVAYERAVRLNGHRDYYLCVLDTTKNADPQCDKFPYQTARGYEPDPNSTAFPFAWSPDSTQIAVTGQPFAAQEDTDLYIFTIADRTWQTLTDDGYEGAFPGEAAIEMQPVWSPNGETIAFERTRMAVDGTLRPAEITLVGATFPDLVTVVNVPGENSAGTTTGLAWSPDNTTLALSVLHREQDAANDGIWLINSFERQMRQLVTLDAIQTALERIYAGMPLQSMGAVSYSPDGTKLLVWAGDAASKPAMLWAFVVDVATGEIKPVPLPPQENDTPEKKSLRPLQAVWSPDGTSMLLMTPGRDRSVDEIPLDPADDSARISLYNVDIASGTPTLIGHLPLGTATGFYAAGWSSDGMIVINGYALKIDAGS